MKKTILTLTILALPLLTSCSTTAQDRLWKKLNTIDTVVRTDPDEASWLDPMWAVSPQAQMWLDRYRVVKPLLQK